MSESRPVCLYCNATDEQLPLVVLVSNGSTYHICPQHLPLLIHEPQKLAGMIPGAEKLKGHES